MLGVTTHPASRERNGRASYPAMARFRAANHPGNRAGPAVSARRRAGPGGLRGRGDALPGAGAAARVPAVAVSVPGRAGGCPVRAGRRGLVRRSRRDVAGAAEPGTGVHPRPRRPLRRACRRPDRRREAVLPAGGGAAAGRGRAGGPRVDRGARRDRPRAAGQGTGRPARRGRGAGAGRVCPLEPAAVRRRRDRLPQAGRVVLPGPGARPQRRLPLPGLVQDRARLGVPVHRGHRPSAHRVGRPGRRGAHRARDPDGADDHAGQERAAPPARRRARPQGRAAVRLRRRLQRRRPHRRAGRLPGPRPGPAGGRLGVLCRSRHLARQVRPSRPPRRRGALPGARGLRRRRRARTPGPEEAAAPQPRTRRDAHLARYPALRHRPGRGLA